MTPEDVAPCPGGPPRVKDVALGALLRCCPPGAVRLLVQRHRAALRAYAPLLIEQERALDPPPRAGRPVQAFWLTEEQCLALVTLLRRLDGPELRAAIEAAFAGRRGAVEVVRVAELPEVPPPALAPAAPGLMGLLREWPDGARIQDLRLGELLGFGRARRVRELIEANLDRLAQEGEVCRAARQTSRSGGRPATEFWLNKRQALRLCMWARTDRADAAQSALLDAWEAWERAHPPAAADVPARLARLETLLVQLLPPGGRTP